MTVEEVIGPLKAHEVRVREKDESNETQLTLTEEEWCKRDREENKLLFTREEWLKRNNKGDTDGQHSSFKTRMTCDESKVIFFNGNNMGILQLNVVNQNKPEIRNKRPIFTDR